MVKLTKEQAAVIGAFTGIVAGPFGDVHEYAEKLFNRPIFTHQFASQAFADELREKARSDFEALCFERPTNDS